MAQLLHHNTFGYTARCPRAAGFVHLCFGNLGLALTPAELADFRTRIASTYRQCTTSSRPPCDPDARCIAVPTPATRMAMVFTLAELTQLVELLDCTALFLEAEELLKGGA
ncbi:hypothetical protein D3Y59_06335 [Hymenobacter oligotrophus]|uniref:Uncharacterized protein n=1 Tax=Hymenobacter oligotrophus TaxID=2319843 RepID=A0A3B7QY20_9BACT|nr:DUF6686 family protein [Hymenobacter oligotrophus]AYA36704.1 hypothetical protein D3Y59_06335 [Hymenobacter oligotrophus]